MQFEKNKLVDADNLLAKLQTIMIKGVFQFQIHIICASNV